MSPKLHPVPTRALGPSELSDLISRLSLMVGGASEWSHAVAVLWLHHCHARQIHPSSARGESSEHYRKIKKDILPQTRKRGISEGQMECVWLPAASALAVKLFEEARQARGAAMGGEMVQLLEDGQ